MKTDLRIENKKNGKKVFNTVGNFLSSAKVKNRARLSNFFAKNVTDRQMKPISNLLLALLATILPVLLIAQQPELADQVTIRRTSYGVPHIKADNLRAAAFGLAYAEIEDYGDRVILPLISARGDLAKIEGYLAIESDFVNQLGYERAVATYHLLSQDTRDMAEGFAAGVNFYLQQHPDKFPQFKNWTFSGYDVAAVSTAIATAADGDARRFVNLLQRKKEEASENPLAGEAGSNTWAFAPSRTKSGKAILVRNPHLSWTAGYYEAQLTVPGKLNFYGDFRIGGVFAIIGGFNERLGWSTTNNNPDLNEIYTLQADPEQPDHYLMDGASVPLQRKMLTAEFRNGEALALETREFLFTPYGPVIHREDGKIYIYKTAGDGEYRRGEQFVRMMLATKLEEWQDAMRMRAITQSNFTYADADGNIFYIWNATIPDLPGASGGDTTAIAVAESSQIWSKPVAFENLPQLLNPTGGYLHNENDPFHFTNLNEVLLPEKYPAYFPAPRLRQRSQLSLELIDNEQKMSLEEVLERKHSLRMLLADQVKEDLITFVQNTKPRGDVKKAIAQLAAWDNTAHPDSRGGALFEAWFDNYARAMRGKEMYRIPWSFEQPMATPRGLSDAKEAVAAFEKAVETLKEKYGTWDLAWGEVHRIRLADVDLPAAGCNGNLGCFRVLWFTEAEDGKLQVRGGDGWQLAVEFTDPPRAYSVLAYGQTNDPASAHHTDQVGLFAASKMKPVAFTEADIQKNLLRAYKPGN